MIQEFVPERLGTERRFHTGTYNDTETINVLKLPVMMYAE